MSQQGPSLQELFEGKAGETPDETQERVDQIFEHFGVGIKALNDNLALPHGPLAKNQATVDFEFIVEKVLEGMRDKSKEDDVNFIYENGRYLARIGQKQYDLSHILENMDGRFIQLSDEAKEAYNQFNPDAPPDYTKDKAKKKKYEEQYQDLHMAEKKAICYYTSQEYKAMNGILRALPPANIEAQFSLNNPENFDMGMKYYMAHIGLALCGLNKIPDTHVKQAFRGEDYREERERDQSLHNPERVVVERGFISTSADQIKWGNKKDLLMFHDVMGKDISGLTHFPEEREFLMPPTQMKYEAKKLEDGKTYYIARPVMTTAGLTPEQIKPNMPEERVNNLLKHVKAIKDEYDNLPKQAKPYVWRQRQIKSLFKEADKLMNDTQMMPDEKYEKMMKKLDGIQNRIKMEEKVKSLFGYESKAKESRLHKIIEEIKEPGGPSTKPKPK